MAKAKKRNPADTTMRNIRPLKSRVLELEKAVRSMDAMLDICCGRLDKLTERLDGKK